MQSIASALKRAAFYRRVWCVGATCAVVALLGTSTKAYASLIIDPTFDASIASVSGAETAINNAISSIEGDISSPSNITVSIYFTSMSSGLGESLTTEYEPTYDQYYTAFQEVATQPNQVTALASLGTAPTSSGSGNPVNGNTSVLLTSAEARNLGFINAPGQLLPNTNISNASGGGAYDSEIGLNTSITSPPNALGGSYGLQAVANHEIDEVLGIGGPGSTLTGTGSLTGPVGVLDLYRYSAPGVRSYSNDSAYPPYFSINGGQTVLSYFNQVPGADFADWQSNPLPTGYGPQVQDAFGQAGTNPALGPNELVALNAIGYDLTSVPEPSTLALLAPLLGLVALRRRQT